MSNDACSSLESVGSVANLRSTTSKRENLTKITTAVLLVAMFWAASIPTAAAVSTWTKVANLAPNGAGVMLLLTDGTIMVQAGATQNWMRLTPNAQGNYINGVWTMNLIAPMSTPRLYFASHVLPSGRVWVLGGEYTGPGLMANWSATAEIYDPVTNAWSPAATYPNTPNCPSASRFGGFTTAGSPIVTGFLSTAGWLSGWTVSGTGIPAGTTILSVDSPTQIHLSQNATANGSPPLTLTVPTTGNTVAGSNIINGIPSTAGFQTGWTVTGSTIPTSAITSVDSPNQIHIANNATATAGGSALTFTVVLSPAACFGDVPSMLLPNGKILAGNLRNNTTNMYDPGTNTWTPAAAKVYNDRSNEETWARMGDGSILNYDVFQTATTGNGYAERYDTTTNAWSSITPAAGTASGTLPILSSSAVGLELGGILRLYDGQMFVIGATGHTALYSPFTNSWAAGPDMLSTLGGAPYLFVADDAPAAILPNGHVILAADAGLGVSSSGNTTLGSNIISGIPSTAPFQVGWAVTGTGIPSGALIQSVDSATEIHISVAATATNTGVALKFGGLFSKPTVILDFDPVAGTISPVSPAIPDPNLNNISAFVTRMLMLPTGQLLFSDSSNQLWVYTSDEAASPPLRPAVSSVTSGGGGEFTLTGTQITGQSAGSSYGDDAESDEDYPVIRLVSRGGNVYYARTTDWNPIGVGTGATPQTVNFTLNPATPPGNYSLIVSAAGISSDPFSFSVGTDLSISKSHLGDFRQGQTVATYSITVSNIGSQATSGTITVSDTLPPSGLAPTSISGIGWSCTQPAGPCTRSSTLLLGDSYPVITLNVNVDLAAPLSVTNTASVSGGGDINPGNNSAADLTTINPATLIPPILVFPSNGATGISSVPVLNWDAVSGATSYDVYLGTTASPPFVANTTSTTYVPSALPLGVLHFWLVVARDALTTVSSSTFSFTTEPPTALRFIPVTPCRVADTRDPVGPYGGPILAAGATRDFIVPETCGIPSSAQAYSLNVGVVPNSTLGYLTVWPAGVPQPFVSTLNSLDGRIKSSAAIIPSGTGGAISVYGTDATHVIVDINGYFVLATDPGGLAFYPVTPCRVADTRLANGPLGGPALEGSATRTFPARTTCGLPAIALAYSLNLTVVPGTGSVQYLTGWPTGQPQPFVASLNSVKPGSITANAAILPAGSNGDINIFVTDNTDLIIDINGYFAPPDAGGLSLYNLTPCRVLDTREPPGSLPFAGTGDIGVGFSGCGTPPTAQAYVLNATVVPPSSLFYLTLWPQGTPQPLVSTLNDLDGSITNNLAIVPTNNTQITAFATDSTHLVMDIFGYFGP